jgi:hypothetical protein
VQKHLHDDRPNIAPNNKVPKRQDPHAYTFVENALTPSAMLACFVQKIKDRRETIRKESLKRWRS